MSASVSSNSVVAVSKFGSVARIWTVGAWWGRRSSTDVASAMRSSKVSAVHGSFWEAASAMGSASAVSRTSMIASNSASEMRAGVRSNAGLPGRRSVADPSVPVVSVQSAVGSSAAVTAANATRGALARMLSKISRCAVVRGSDSRMISGLVMGAVGVFDACLRDVVDSVVCEGLCVGSCVAGESFEDCVGGWGVFDQC